MLQCNDKHLTNTAGLNLSTVKQHKAVNDINKHGDFDLL